MKPIPVVVPELNRSSENRGATAITTIAIDNSMPANINIRQDTKELPCNGSPSSNSDHPLTTINIPNGNENENMKEMLKSKSPTNRPRQVITPIRAPNPKIGSPKIITRRPKTLYFTIKFLLECKITLASATPKPECFCVNV